MTTETRAAPLRPSMSKPTSNFHAPAALDAYGRRFHRIGIASVAAAAAQVKPDVDKDRRSRLPAHLRDDGDAA